MGKRAALLAVIMLGSCGGGGAAKQPVPPRPDTQPEAKPKTPPPPPRPTEVPVDVATLEVWPGSLDGGPVTVAAADVDGEVLRRVIVPAAIEIITVRNDARVTGRVTGSRVGVLSALVAASPGLKLGARARLAGKGPPAELDLVGADSREVFQRLADAMKTNVVVIAPEQKLTVSAKAPSAQKLLDEVAKAAGLVTEKAAANVVVVRAKSQPKVGKLAGKGAKLDLDVRGARPGDVLGLVAVVTGAAAPTGACSPGQPISMRLRAVPSGIAEKLVLKAGGDAKAAACPITPVTDPDLAKLTLVASATSGGETLWLAMDGDRAVAFESKGGAGWPADDGADAGGATGDPLAGGRLAATITGIGSGVAIVEVGGAFRVLAAGDAQPGLASVGLGEAEVVDATGGKRTLKLAKRPP